METSARPTSRRGTDFSQELCRRGWYHSFELPDGTRIDGIIPLDTLKWRWTNFRLPAVLKSQIDSASCSGVFCVWIR